MAVYGKPGWQWIGDPITGELSRVSASGERLTATLEALTDDVFTFSNGTMFDAALHRIRWNTSKAFPFYVTQLEHGQIHVLNPVRPSEANQRVNSAGGYVFTYSVDITLPNGEVRTVTDGITAASPAGARLAVRLGEAGQLSYLYANRDPVTGAFPENPPVSGYRWATSDEVRHRSVVSALLREPESKRALEDAIAQGLYDVNGVQIISIYEAAQYFTASDPVTQTYAQAIFTYAA